MTKYDLHLFDLDGTLVPFDSNELYEDVKFWLDRNHNWAIVSNQGGVGLRYWMETPPVFGDPEKYPTEDDVYNRVYKIFEDFYIDNRVWFCFAYQSKSSGRWNPTPPYRLDDKRWSETWRKPNPGMLLDAMDYFNTSPEKTLMVGDSEEDQLAAYAANCDFMWCNEFFEREMAVD